MTLLDIDPNVVKPGWTPLIITIVLAAVMVLLFLSMRRQFRKINVPQDQAADKNEPVITPPTRQV
ncbi:MAG: hypothetical protein H0T91_03990 [Propionibacteriaceae bacterium]|nr:hypothetical protein [Propionibacteriaceae bacterium]